MAKAYKALLLDCDGTILDTIHDLTDAVNGALETFGLPAGHDDEDTKTFIGNGPDRFIESATGKPVGSPEFIAFKKVYLANYEAFQVNKTRPFKGIKETLDLLKRKGVRLIVATNKPDKLAHIICDLNYGEGYFEGIYGFVDGGIHKPAKGFIDPILNDFGLSADECLYVGDSKPDVLTGENSHMDVALCLWGYGDYKSDIVSRSQYVLKEPEDLYRVALGL